MMVVRKNRQVIWLLSGQFHFSEIHQLIYQAHQAVGIAV
jgi:hypothetical protein